MLILARHRKTRYPKAMQTAGSRSPGFLPWLPVTAILALLFLYSIQSIPSLIDRWGISAPGLALALGWLLLAGLAVPLFRTAPTRLMVGLLLTIALALRLGFALLVINRAPQGDAQFYLTLAASLRNGTGLAVFEPFLGIMTHALFPPLYPCMLAIWSFGFGLSTVSLLVLSTIIDAATAVLIGFLGARLGNIGAGRGAAWLYLIWPSALLSAPLAQKESLCSLLVLILAIAWVGQGGSARSKYIMIGLAAGLLALTQPDELPLAALFGLVLAGQLGLREVLWAGIRALLVALVVMLPWWFRNWLTFGAFVPLTSSGGLSLWVGNNPNASGNWIAPPAALRHLPELELSRRAGAMARSWIAAYPAQFAELTIRKFVRACGIGEFGLVRLTAMHPALSAATARLLLPLSHGAHMAMLGGAATATALRADSALKTALLLVAACGLQLLLFGMWFEFGERHREFATPFLLLLICMAISHVHAVRSSAHEPREAMIRRSA